MSLAAASVMMLARIGGALLGAQAVPPPAEPVQEATASFYFDGGQTACGFHARYGFASLFLPCGARVLMRGPGGQVIATMQDRGPFSPGRLFDLNPPLKAALGCGDLCVVRYRVLP